MLDRGKVATVVAEFLGTGFLVLLILSVQRSSIGVPFFVAAIAGLTTVVLVLAFSDVSGAYLNPAIALGLWTARKLSTLRAIFLIAAELLGAWVAYYIYSYLSNTKLTAIGGHFSGRTLLAESIAAGILGIAWAAASFNNWTKANKAAVVGIAFMAAMILASSAGIGLANPAVALGVRAWVWGTYVAGPVIGAVVGINLYGLLFTEGGLDLSKAKSALMSSGSSKPKAKATNKKATAK